MGRSKLIERTTYRQRDPRSPVQRLRDAERARLFEDLDERLAEIDDAHAAAFRGQEDDGGT